ncbi:MAG: gliding motility-associated C-terminal domain-containing protein [Saprospiraceae bacterium]|nr:gliding motility-associated C-terminal domain-containing protein [Saprospiraceae bacterium]
MKKGFLLLLFLSVISISGFSADYYWVGGSGNWSDLSHWVTTSGGTVTHSQVPTSEDNVIFDANSFTGNGQTVFMNAEIMFFRNMDWTGVSFDVNFNGGREVIMNSFGSIDLGARVNFNFRGIVTLNGSTNGNVLNYNGNIAGREMYFTGEGSWEFNSNIEMDSIFQINQGTVATNGFSLRTKYLYILTNSAKTFDLGSSTIEVWGNFGDREFYHETFDTITSKINATNLTIIPGTSTINFTAALTEVWFQGSGNINFNDVNFTSNAGRNYLRPYEGDPLVTFNTLRLNGSTRIEGQQDMAQLLLNRKKVYRFESGRTYNIGAIDAIGTCAEGIVITSNDAGIEATINSSGTINLDFVTLRDIRGQGGTFNATNSTDLGNNNNWIFTNSNTLDFYWIGGTGDWTDPNHWSFTSGGPPSGCVPAGKDRAYFDANSFTGAGQIVTIDIEDVFVRDMIWDGVTGNPSLAGDGEYSMHITGSMRMDANMQHTFGGYYYFESSLSGNTLELNGQHLNRECHFNGQNADWTLLDDLYVEWNLSHNSGTLISGGNNMEMFKYLAYGSRTTHLDMRNSYILIRDTYDENGNAVWRPEWYVDTENFTAETDNSTIEFQSGLNCWFYHNGPNRIEYNNLIYSCYFGEISGYNWTTPETSAVTVDSVIYRSRGSMYGHQVMNYVELAAGFDYIFQDNQNYYFMELSADGNCDDGHISISSNNPGLQTNFNIDVNHTFERLMIKDINQQGSGVLTANNSVDRGNNNGWVIDSISARVLYWVNNEGHWEDSSHWSLTSGGPGGECVPTAIDDVIFDENSFDQNNQGVASDANRFITCRNMTWDNVFGRPNFGYYYDNVQDIGYWTDRIRINGSLIYDNDMDRSTYWHHMATNQLDSITSNGIEIPGLVKEGRGLLRFKDDLLNWNYDHYNGSLDASNITWTLNYWYQDNFVGDPQTIDLSNTIIQFGRDQNGENTMQFYGSNTDFVSTNNVIYFNSSINNFISTRGVDLNRVIATNPSSITYLGDRRTYWNKDPSTPRNNFQSLRFSGDAYILGEIETDTLIGSPGKTYTLEAGETQNVNRYLQLIGNNCTPIQLRSDSPGLLGTFSMPSAGNVSVNFIEMRDNRGTGGAEFIAGARSTDIAMSNVGWVFEDPPEFVETGFLGPDRALCNDASLELSAFNFSPSETYLWNDNSTDTTITVNQTGIYSVQVTFGNGCQIEDEIIILEPQDVNVDLGSDTTICENTSITIDGSLGIQGVTYIWNDDLMSSSREVSEAGNYSLIAEVDGCVSTDTVTIEVQPIPFIDLEEEQTYCEGDQFTLNAALENANYLWQDGSADSTFTGSIPGLYWVEVEINLCTYRDSININYVSTPEADLGIDTTLCDGEVLQLATPEVSGATFTWQDGTTGRDYTVTEEGPYVVYVDITGCVNTDSIYVSYQEIPTFELGDNQVLCEGTPFILDASSIPGVSYTWQDGTTDPVYSGTMEGQYLAEAMINGCAYRDSVQIAYVPIPPAEIGNDTTLCVGQTVNLETPEFGSSIYTWQDGSTGNTYLVTAEGSYVVRVDNMGCIRTDSIYVTYQDAPDFELGETIQACQDDVVDIETSVMADNYMWNTGDNTPNISVTNTGTYTLLIQVGECFLEDSVLVNFNAYPDLELGNDTMICDRESLTLTTEIVGIWQDGTQSDQYTVSNEGEYKVILDNNGCISSDSITIGIIPLPDVDIGESIQNACDGDVVTLAIPQGSAEYQWDDGTDDVSRSIVVSGEYWLEALENGCTNRDSVSVTFFDNPIIELGRDTTVCDDEGLLLQPTKSEGTITWPDGSTGNSFQVDEAGWVNATISNNGCESMDSVFVTLRVCNYFDAYIPNAFSPNEDGTNDKFLPVFQDGVTITEYSMAIFDRWGNRVFTSNDISEPWDGRLDSSQTPSGVYVYVIEVSFIDDRQSGSEVISGDVSIIR